MAWFPFYWLASFEYFRNMQKYQHFTNEKVGKPKTQNGLRTIPRKWLSPWALVLTTVSLWRWLSAPIFWIFRSFLRTLLGFVVGLWMIHGGCPSSNWCAKACFVSQWLDHISCFTFKALEISTLLNERTASMWDNFGLWWKLNQLKYIDTPSRVNLGPLTFT